MPERNEISFVATNGKLSSSLCLPIRPPHPTPHHPTRGPSPFGFFPKVHAVDAQMGGMRRAIECISITDDDKHAYCGTRTGDVLKFKIDRDDIRV